MFQYLLILLAGVAVINGPSLSALVAGGPSMDYMVALGVALLLKPWLAGHFE